VKQNIAPHITAMSDMSHVTKTQSREGASQAHGVILSEEGDGVPFSASSACPAYRPTAKSNM